MIDLYLKFIDRTHMLEILNSLDMLCSIHNDELRVKSGNYEYSAWEIGQIPMTDGWHVNLRVIDPNFDISALEKYRVYPATPHCVWA